MQLGVTWPQAVTVVVAAAEVCIRAELSSPGDSRSARSLWSAFAARLECFVVDCESRSEITWYCTLTLPA